MGDGERIAGNAKLGGLADKMFDREIDGMEEDDSFEDDYELVDIRGRRKAM